MNETQIDGSTSSKLIMRPQSGIAQSVWLEQVGTHVLPVVCRWH